MQERGGEAGGGEDQGRGGEEGKVCYLFVMCTVSQELFSKCQMVSARHWWDSKLGAIMPPLTV